MVTPRIKTGIGGLDDVLEGIPRNRTIVLTGDAGTGKTVFALQFARNCCSMGLKTIFMSTEETQEDLRSQMRSFGWDMKKAEEEGLFTLMELTSARIETLESKISIQDKTKGEFESILDNIPEGTSVLVFDSLGSHTDYLLPREFRDRLNVLIFKLMKRNITALLIIDSATSKEFHGLALFSAYGAVQLSKQVNPYTGHRERIMDIVKMRNTKTPLQPLTFRMGSKGIELIESRKQDEETSSDKE